MPRTTRNATARNARRVQPSRTPEAKRERRIIRRFLRVATILNAIDTTAPEYGELSVELMAANTALATIPGYSVEEND